MRKKVEDTPERRLDAAQTFMAMEGGFESMISRGTHLDDLGGRILRADPETSDLTSLYQLMEIADRMTYGVSTSYKPPIENPPTEPYIDPDIARDWLTRQTARAIDRNGTLKFRADQRPDHLGFAAMEIALGEEPRLFSVVYAEVTNSQSPLSDEFLQNLAHTMVDGYFTE